MTDLAAAGRIRWCSATVRWISHHAAATPSSGFTRAGGGGGRPCNPDATTAVAVVVGPVAGQGHRDQRRGPREGLDAVPTASNEGEHGPVLRGLRSVGP